MMYRFAETTYSGLHPCEQQVDGKWPSALTGYNLENWKANTNEQIKYHGPALLGRCEHHGFHRSNLVEAAIDAK